MPTSASLRNSCSSMSFATMSSLDGGSRVPGSATAASMRMPQFAPVQPPLRSHPASTATTRMQTMIGEVERRCMALNISPRRERCNNGGRADGRTVGRCKTFPPMVDHRCRDVCERYGPSKHNGQRGFSRASSHTLLRSIEEDRAMLQECAATPDLGRSDELAPVHEDLPADGGCKAGRRMGGWADGR